MPNPDGTLTEAEALAIQQPQPPQSLGQVLDAAQHTEELDAFEDYEDATEEGEETVVREVSPEELAERMRQMGLPAETTPPVGPVPQMAAQANEVQREIDQMLARVTNEAQTIDEMTNEYRDFRVRQDDRFPHPEQGELVMTRAQLGRTRRLEIRDKPFRVASMAGEPPRAMWWLSPGQGVTAIKSDAYVWNWEQMMNLSNHPEQFIYIQYDNLPTAAPVAEPAKDAPSATAKPAEPERRRKSNWITTLGQPLVNMISAYPKNGMFRARVLAILKEPIPDEMDTATKIRDWIEFEFPRDPAQVARTNGLKFEVAFSHTESGRVDYTRHVDGAYKGEMTRKRLVEIVRANKEMDWDQLVATVRNEMVSVALASGVLTPGQPTLENFEATNRTNQNDVLLTSIRSLLREILKMELTRDEIADLGI